VVSTLLGVAFDVLKVFGSSGRESDRVGSEEGGSDVFISSCGFGCGESLAKFFPLQWACQFLSTGFHCSAAVKVGSLFFGCVGREVGWFGGRKGFGVIGIGSFSSKQKAAWSVS